MTMRELNRRLARVWLVAYLRGLTDEPPPPDLVELLTLDERRVLERRDGGTRGRLH